METSLVEELFTLASAFGAAKRMEEATVGRLCASDGRFFARLRGGKTFTIRKYDAVLCWFSANWPADTAWPEGIARPEPAAATDEAAA